MSHKSTRGIYQDIPDEPSGLSSLKRKSASKQQEQENLQPAAGDGASPGNTTVEAKIRKGTAVYGTLRAQYALYVAGR